MISLFGKRCHSQRISAPRRAQRYAFLANNRVLWAFGNQA